VEEGQHDLGIAIGIVNGPDNPLVLTLSENVNNDMAERHMETAGGRVPPVPFGNVIPHLFFGAFGGGLLDM
jgi:hypothetical protein